MLCTDNSKKEHMKTGLPTEETVQRWLSKAENEDIQRPLFLVRNHCTDIDNEDDKRRVKQDVLEKLDYDKPLDVYFIDCGRNKTGIDELKKDVENPTFINLWKKRIISKFEEAKESYLSNSSYYANEDIDTYKKMASVNGINPVFGADIAVDIGIYFKMLSDVNAYAWAGALNAMNPVPGVDVSVDVGIFYKMMKNIRESFGFGSDEELKKYMVLGPVAKQLINRILEYATKEGIITDKGYGTLIVHGQ